MTAPDSGREAAVCANPTCADCGSVLEYTDRFEGYFCDNPKCQNYSLQPAPAAPPPAAPGFPRRNQMLQWSTGERAIQEAVDIVERMGADVRLTDAVILLGKARDRVADFVDGVAPDSTVYPPVAAAPSGARLADYDDYRLSQEISGRATRKALVELRAAAPSGARDIQRIQQEDRLGCGVACLAMVSGRTYAQVRADFSPETIARITADAVGNGVGLSDYALIVWLNREDFWHRRSWMEGPESKPCPTTGVAILQVDCGHYTHWVVSVDGRILDPERETPSPSYRVLQAIEVQRPAALATERATLDRLRGLLRRVTEWEDNPWFGGSRSLDRWKDVLAAIRAELAEGER